MAKLVLFLAFVSLGRFETTQSISFECKFIFGDWGNNGRVYRCDVTNSVSIISPDAAQIDSISGIHEAGYSNNVVEAFNTKKGQIHYFPRGLDKIFKYLNTIQIMGTGLKEIHQSDLKDFPNLKSLYLAHNNLEKLEKNLFEFNPNLEAISLSFNKISYIDPNVFDMMTKLKILFLEVNTCIDISAQNNPTQLQKVIRTVKSECTGSKVFTTTTTQPLTTTTTLAKTTTESIKFETCSALEVKVDNIAEDLKDLKAQTTNLTCSVNIDKNLIDNGQCEAFMNARMEILEENVENFKILALREIMQIKAAVKDAHWGLMMSLNFMVDKLERKIEEQNQKFEENLKKIMKALFIDG